MTTYPRQPLSAPAIIDAAMRVADRDGLAKLSMRNIGAELGYEAMSLYGHVGKKADVLTGMVEAVCAELELPAIGEDFDWRAALRHNAIELRDLFEQRPWAVQLWVSSIPGPRRFDLMEWQLAAIAASGLPEDEAHLAFHALFNHTVGTMLQRHAMANAHDAPAVEGMIASVQPGRHAHVLQHIDQHMAGDSGDTFEFVLDVLLARFGSTG